VSWCIGCYLYSTHFMEFDSSARDGRPDSPAVVIQCSSFCSWWNSSSVCLPGRHRVGRRDAGRLSTRRRRRAGVDIPILGHRRRCHVATDRRTEGDRAAPNAVTLLPRLRETDPHIGNGSPPRARPAPSPRFRGCSTSVEFDLETGVVMNP
jgi:hypothetical protein